MGNERGKEEWMRKIAVLVGCLWIFTATWAYAVEISVKPYYWGPDLDTRARIEKNNIGDEIDFDRDLDMDDESILGATVGLKLGRSNHFSLAYWGADYDGNTVISRSFRFNGIPYSAGERVRSEFDLDAVELGYAFDIMDFETFRLGLMLNLNAFFIDTELRSDSNPAANEENLDLLYPLAGIRFGVGFLDNKLQFTGQFGGLWWQGSGWWDGASELSYYPLKNLGISAGYRWMHYDISDDDDSVNMRFEGLTASATLRV
jgi:hypothetical protein